ncbi:MAG: TRAP transporter large permease [Burkholderiaceae bacterium]
MSALAALALALTVALLLGVPVAYALIAAGAAAILATGGTPLMIVPQQIFAGFDSVLLLAIPFFLLAGDLMTTGGITERMLDFANAVLGRLRGGLAISNVAGATFMAGISGSAVADTSAIGRVLIPAMIREGYHPGFAAALTAAANVVGPIIPPSITFIMIGVLTNLSITKLFLAGILPGILYSVAMAITAYVISVRRHYPTHGRVPAIEIWRTFVKAFWALVMPVLIVGGIRLGVFNVTECSAAAVVYAFVVGKFVYRELKWSDVWGALRRSARTTAVILIVLGGAQVVSWFLAYNNVPQAIAKWMLGFASSPWVFLLIVNVFLLVVGTFLENAPALVMLAPVLYPVSAQYGIDPIHFSMIVALNLLIGLITPPVAICLSLGSLIARCPPREAAREVMPFLAAAIVVLLLVTFVPLISLGLPNLLK